MEGVQSTCSENPFRIPEAGGDSCQYSGLESDRGNEGETGDKHLKIWERGNSRKSRSEWLRELLGASEKEEDNEKKKQKENIDAQKNSLDRIMRRIEKYITSKVNHDEKEALNEFISKKREIFLLQMSLNIKKDEIRKLDCNAKAKEEALQKSEEMLEDDALRFDLFLKDNDKKAQDAIRLAEKETKKKMEKVQEVKKLNQQLQVLQSSNNKHKTNLEECIRFKSFLEDLAPSKWFQEQTDKKRLRQRERRRKRIESRRSKWIQEQENIIAPNKEFEAGAIESPRGERARRRKEQNEVDTKVMSLPPMPDFEDEELTSSDEDMPMFFDKPHQLPDIFSALEEENLFLIQNTQEAEQSLDEMTQRFDRSQSDIQKKADTMQEYICEIKRNIKVRRGSVASMKADSEDKTCSALSNEKKLMNNLTMKVKSVYQTCGFEITGATPSTLFMLGEVESKMESIISRIHSMPEHMFKHANKQKEKKRREGKRAQQQAEQLKIQEERNRKAIERSMQPPKKPQGKKVRFQKQFLHSLSTCSIIPTLFGLPLLQVMYRSYLVQKQKTKQKTRENDQNEDESRFLM